MTIVWDHWGAYQPVSAGEPLPEAERARMVPRPVLADRAGALCRDREVPPWGHNFPDLFDAQPETVQAWIESEFGARSLGTLFDTGRTLPAQLGTLTTNHQRARYVYERTIPFTEQQRLEREQGFLDGTLPEEEWDIIFYSGLVRLLAEALLGYLTPWVPSWFDPREADLFPPESLSHGKP